MVAGFGVTSSLMHLLDALAETQLIELPLIVTNVGEAGLGGGQS